MSKKRLREECPLTKFLKEQVNEDKVEHTDVPVPTSTRPQVFDHDDNSDYEPQAKDTALKGFVKQ